MTILNENDNITKIIIPGKFYHIIVHQFFIRHTHTHTHIVSPFLFQSLNEDMSITEVLVIQATAKNGAPMRYF